MNIDITQQQTVPTTGARLREARERMGFTRQVIAERLCLTVSIIRGIEEDKAQSSLTPLFFRGYVRSYAKLVDIPEDELLPDLKNDSQLVVTPKIASMQHAALRKRKKRDTWLIYFTWLIIAVVLGLTGVWWWQNYKAQQEEFASMIDNSADQQDDNELTVAKSDDETDSGIAVGTIDSNDSDEQTADISDSEDSSVASDQLLSMTEESATDDSDMLTMDFSSDCWLQVTDASGKTLFDGIQQTGSKLNLTGKEPYKLVIGAPSAVQIQYQGKEIDLSSFVKAKRTARFMIP